MTGLSAALIASNAAKQRLTHCPKGHPYAGPNLYVNPYHKGRVCRTCHNLNQRERRRQKAGRQGTMAQTAGEEAGQLTASFFACF